eukprot:9010668-Pyramimonas_sp.AAC.1
MPADAADNEGSEDEIAHETVYIDPESCSDAEEEPPGPALPPKPKPKPKPEPGLVAMAPEIGSQTKAGISDFELARGGGAQCF